MHKKYNNTELVSLLSERKKWLHLNSVLKIAKIQYANEYGIDMEEYCLGYQTYKKNTPTEKIVESRNGLKLIDPAYVKRIKIPKDQRIQQSLRKTEPVKTKPDKYSFEGMTARITSREETTGDGELLFDKLSKESFSEFIKIKDIILSGSFDKIKNCLLDNTKVIPVEKLIGR